MPKMTAKYSAALDEAKRLKIKPLKDQEELYHELSEHGLMWDSDQKEWVDLSNEPADPPTEMIMVRVWSDAEVVEEAADLVQETFKKGKFKLVERSNAYACRPPKQLEARIYLKFMKP